MNTKLEILFGQMAEQAQTVRALRESVAGLRQSSARDAARNQVSLAQLNQHLAELESRVVIHQQALRQFYESRTWQALVAMGNILLRMAARAPEAPSAWPSIDSAATPAPSFPDSRTATPAEPADLQPPVLVCDQPGTNGIVAVRGLVEVRGWAIHPTGIREIQLQIDGQAPIPAQYGHLRPDVAGAYPEHRGSDRSGYYYLWDTELVSEGNHTLLIKALAMDGATAECRCDVVVDPLGSYVYNQWIALREPPTAEYSRLAETADASLASPVINLFIPLHKVPLPLLKTCLDSILAQLYPHWELYFAGNGSIPPEIAETLGDYASRDDRVRFPAGPDLCRGDYVLFLDPASQLAVPALFELVQAIHDFPDADLFYSDEDQIDPSGRRFSPFFKPGWSPNLFLSYNYLGHFLFCKRSLLDRAGGMDPLGWNHTFYELLLRLTEHAQIIKRIPKILYHRSALPAGEQSEASIAGATALSDYLRRHSPGARVEGFRPSRYRVIYPVDTSQTVTIIMPSGGHLHYLGPALEDIFHKTSYPNYEILIVDNSRASDVLNLVKTSQRSGNRIRYMDRRGHPFNFSRLNNDAVAQTQSPLILFLNDDITVINEDWLTAMVEHAQRREVGAVGALLLYPDGRIQHAGVTMGLHQNADHLFKKLPPKPGACFDLPLVVRDCSAVTAACLLTRREVFLEVGGFDVENLAVAFQDVDLCLKIHERGYRIVYTPFSRLYHHESVTKAEKVPNPKEVRFMQEKWQSYIADDPYYNPNLSRNNEHYTVRLD